MPPLSPVRRIELEYHLGEARAWLSLADGGKATTMVALAAFELRLAIERLLFQYLHALSPVQSAEAFEKSAGAWENVIYRLEGHQRIIDRKFEFFDVLFRLLGRPGILPAPNLGRLKRHWHTCSEFCHVQWTIAAYSADEKLLGEPFADLQEAVTDVAALIDRGRWVAWPKPEDPGFEKLYREFVEGHIGEADVERYIRRRGIWGRLQRPDGSVEVFGEGIPPASD